MKSNEDSIPLLKWADRGMQQYLYLVDPAQPFNTSIAKVYYQSGQILSSTLRYADRYVEQRWIDAAVSERKEYLQQKVAEHVARRLDNALQGET